MEMVLLLFAFILFLLLNSKFEGMHKERIIHWIIDNGPGHLKSPICPCAPEFCYNMYVHVHPIGKETAE